MENRKNKIIGFLVLIIIIASILFYNIGKVDGKNMANAIFLDSAWIESCEEDGTSCILETNQGQKIVFCNEYNNCITQEKMPGEREQEMQETLDFIMNNLKNKE